MRTHLNSSSFLRGILNDMDVFWRPDDPLNRIRKEIARSRPEERGCHLKPLAELHVGKRGASEGFDKPLWAETVLGLLPGASLFERMTFAQIVATGGRLPTEVLSALLADVYLVSRPLVENARLSDVDLLAVIDRDASESTLMVIAVRRGIGVPVTDRVTDLGTHKVHLMLAANDGAALSRATFDRFSNLTQAQNEMDMALATRSDLPHEIAKALHQRLSERAAKRLDEMLIRDRNRGRRAFALGR